VLQLFAKEIDALYADFEGESEHSDDNTAYSGGSISAIADQVKKIFEEVIDNPPKSFDSSRNLFELGLDSVTAMRLRKQLALAFGISVTPQFIYQNLSVDLLSHALHERVHSRSVSPTIERGDILFNLIQRQLDSINTSLSAVLASRTIQVPPSDGQVVAVVGAAGSLGIWQVKSLLEDPGVRQVVCLVRGATVSDIYDKVSTAFKNARLDGLVAQCSGWKEEQLRCSEIPAVELDQKLVVIPYDLSNPQLQRKDYFALASRVTTIVHTGWKMDFNQVVQDFERDCLVGESCFPMHCFLSLTWVAGTTQLLILAAFVRPKKFYFISSIGVVLESDNSPVPEVIEPWTRDQHISASPHGYSESKFVCEQVIQTAAKLLEIPCSIARVGQISGDTKSGVWKVCPTATFLSFSFDVLR
jgi:aryl carrier-like protein